MSDTPLEHTFIDLPVPTAKREAKVRDAMWALLSGLEAGKAVEINRGKRAAMAYVYRYQRQSGTAALFTTRASAKAGWSRIWRVR